MRGTEGDMEGPWSPPGRASWHEHPEKPTATRAELDFLIDELKAVSEIRSTNTRIKIISKRLIGILGALANQQSSKNGQRITATPSAIADIR